MKTNDLIVDWPAGIEKPALPPGYEWVCLMPALGLTLHNGGHPWLIRLTWTMRNGKNRMLPMPGYFDTAEFAVHRAVDEARKHAERQRSKEQ